MICGITGGGLRKRLWTVFEALLVQTFGVSGRSGFCGLIEELFWTPCTSVMYSFLASALNWVALERKRFRGLEKKITSQCDDAGGDVSWSSVFVGSFCVASERRETGPDKIQRWFNSLPTSDPSDSVPSASPHVVMSHFFLCLCCDTFWQMWAIELNTQLLWSPVSLSPPRRADVLFVWQVSLPGFGQPLQPAAPQRRHQAVDWEKHSQNTTRQTRCSKIYTNIFCKNVFNHSLAGRRYLNLMDGLCAWLLVTRLHLTSSFYCCNNYNGQQRSQRSGRATA